MSTEPVERDRHPYRWVMLAGVSGVYFSFGLVMTAIAPVVAVVGRDLGLSKTALGSALGCWQLVYVGMAIPGGAFIDRFGVRPALFLAGVTIALSGVLRATSTGYVSLLLAVGVFGIGGPLLSVGAPKLVQTWFSGRDRGLAIGIYMSSVGLGSMASLALTQSVVMPWLDDSWRAVLVAYACVALVSAFAWALVAHHPLSRAAQVEDRAREGTAAGTYAALLRMPIVQSVLMLALGTFMFSHGIINWLPEALRSAGLTATAAGNWAALSTGVGVVAALIVPALATPDRRTPILVALLLLAGASLFLLDPSHRGAFGVGLVALGTARACITPIALLLLMESPRIGARHMAAAGALFFTSGEIGGALGPFLFGAIADQSGFDRSLQCWAGLAMLLIVVVLRMRKHAHPS
ncbi:MAG: MFS transporter [Deltaproteobacteria bacterium]|nr:MFS transporter [Deltaproteobacteria bacterium]MBW2413992.1 MFS transporter [Deltaproteobacteria bacterium]